MINYYLMLGTFILFIFFIIYLMFDFMTSKSGNAANVFMDRWAKKTLWIWLPFYALQRLIKEVILKQK